MIKNIKVRDESSALDFGCALAPLVKVGLIRMFETTSKFTSFDRKYSADYEPTSSTS